MKAWIETYTGVKFDLLNPKPEMVRIEDIAHALSMQCRFTGHTQKFYSVGEHSYHVSFKAKENPLYGLLHDASEAYLSDLSRPVKHLTPVGAPYMALEKRLMGVVCQKFGLPTGPMPEDVKNADNLLLFTEKKKLMGDVSWAKDGSSNFLDGKVDDSIPITGWSPVMMRQMFLDRYFTLTGE